MSSLVFCSAWICRDKEKQKCAEIEINVCDEDFEGITSINLCSQCLTDALEEFK